MSSVPRPLKVLIADDHAFTRAGLIYALKQRPDIQVVGQAETGLEAVEAVQKIRPDVVLMDIEMPLMDGIQATRQIKAQVPETKVAILTSRQLVEEIQGTLAAGADAYCMKDISTDKLVHVLQTICEGALWLDPGIARKITTLLPAHPQPPYATAPAFRPSGRLTFTPREHQVLEQLTEGKSNKEIAEFLKISTHTVKTHVRNLIQKLGVDDRTQVVLKALQFKLVEQKAPVEDLFLLPTHD